MADITTPFQYCSFRAMCVDLQTLSAPTSAHTHVSCVYKTCTFDMHYRCKTVLLPCTFKNIGEAP